MIEVHSIDKKDKYINENKIILVSSKSEMYYKRYYVNKDYKIKTVRNYLFDICKNKYKMINKNQEVLFMNSSLKKVYNSLKFYKDVEELSFTKELIKTYKDYKNYKLINNDKVNDLTVIFDEYEKLLRENKFLNDNMLFEYSLKNEFDSCEYVVLDIESFSEDELNVIKSLSVFNSVIILKNEIPNEFVIENLKELQNIDTNYKDKYIKNKKVYEASVNDIEEEVNFVLNDISKKIINGASYNDFLIVSNSIEEYYPYFDLYFNFPYNKTRKEGTLTKRFISILSDILNGNFSCSNFVNLLKLNVFDVDDKTINDIDNYVYSWNLENESFYLPFKFNPSSNRKILSSKDELKLKNMNDTKDLIINPVKYFLENIIDEKCVNTILKEFYTFLDVTKINERLFNYDKEGYNKLINILEDINEYYNFESSVTDLINLIDTMYDTSKKSTITNDMIKLDSLSSCFIENRKYIYLLGASLDNLPKQFKFTSLINKEDIKNDELINIVSKYVKNQDYLFNKLFLCDTLTISYHKLSSDLKLLEKSNVLKELNTIKLKIELYNKDTILSDYAIKISEKKVYETNYNDEFKKINDISKYKISDHISSLAAKKIYGNSLLVSPSSIETYSKCPFYYFMEYVLKLNVKEKYTFDRRSVGTYVHYILENIIKNEWNNVSFDNLYDIVLKYEKKYVDENLWMVDKSTLYVLEKLSKSTVLLLKNIISEQKISDFRPKYFEFKIADDMIVKPNLINLDKADLKIKGIVDRVDVYETDDTYYYRIIDYKTGDKKLRLDDCLVGLNLQMLLYLLAIKDSSLTNKKIVPSAVLYYPALIKDLKESRENDAEKIENEAIYRNKMNGIVNCDKTVLDALGNDDAFNYIDFASRGKVNDEKVFGVDNLNKLFDKVLDVIKDIGNELLEGNFRVYPVMGRVCACDYCRYSSICSFDKMIDEYRKLKNYKNSEVFKMLDSDDI